MIRERSLDEISGLEAAGLDVQSQLRVSNRAHVIFPFHRTIEKISEGRENRVAIGTTSRGIGPCYEDKIARRGIRIADLIDVEFEQQYRALAEDKRLIANAFAIADPGNFDQILEGYKQFAVKIRPLVCDTAHLLNRMIGEGKIRALRGRAGHHARHRFRDVSFCYQLQRRIGGRLHRDRRSSH